MDDRLMLVLDASCTREHVLAELRALSPLVTGGQYLVESGIIVEDISAQWHRPRPGGPGDNPKTAVREFVSGDGRSLVDEALDSPLVFSHCVDGYLTRKF